MVTAGFAGPLRFAMVTDTHVGVARAVSAARLSRVYAAIARLAPDFVLHCGDITDTGLPDEYDLYQQAVPAALRGRVRRVQGNHDVRWDSTAKGLYREHFGPAPYSFDAGGIHFIGFDPAQALLEPGHCGRACSGSPAILTGWPPARRCSCSSTSGRLPGRKGVFSDAQDVHQGNPDHRHSHGDAVHHTPHPNPPNHIKTTPSTAPTPAPMATLNGGGQGVSPGGGLPAEWGRSVANSGTARAAASAVRPKRARAVGKLRSRTAWNSRLPAPKGAPLRTNSSRVK